MPIQDGCPLVLPVLPSTLADEYDNPTSGARPPGTGGTRIG
ncbi:hypothetical protein ACFQ07_33535 [Actinomadura adrarensis]|uniref:Uncharacterized protein n=1 Tax=Actinomadura adrarensis TaxID=1819600 RepID=A0ABW3CRN9_9ACTN